MSHDSQIVTNKTNNTKCKAKTFNLHKPTTCAMSQWFKKMKTQLLSRHCNLHSNLLQVASCNYFKSHNPTIKGLTPIHLEENLKVMKPTNYF